MNTSLNSSPWPAVRCVASAPREVDTELLVVPVFENDTSDLGIDGLDEATGGEINRARTSREFRAKPNEVFLARIVDGNWRAARIALIGVGKQEVDGSARFRTAASVASLKARRHRVDRMAFIVRGGIDLARDAQAVAEGIVLGSFEDRRYKTTSDDEVPGPLVDAQVVLGSVTRASPGGTPPRRLTRIVVLTGKTGRHPRRSSRTTRVVHSLFSVMVQSSFSRRTWTTSPTSDWVTVGTVNRCRMSGTPTTSPLIS